MPLKSVLGIFSPRYIGQYFAHFFFQRCEFVWRSEGRVGLAHAVNEICPASSANLHFTFSLFDAFQLLTSLEKSEKLKSEKAIYVSINWVKITTLTEIRGNDGQCTGLRSMSGTRRAR